MDRTLDLLAVHVFTTAEEHVLCAIDLTDHS